VSVDSHCHLADEVYTGDLQAVATRAREAGVRAALCILSADEPSELERVPAVRQAWPDIAFAAGIHPHRAAPYAGRPDEARHLVAEAVRAVRAVVVGEIGLDYHYDHSPRPVQREVFAAQLDAAAQSGLPVTIHTRDATDDTLDVLREAGGGLSGVMHCFSGTVAEARRALDLGFLISISGIVTFPKAGGVRTLAAFIPADRLLIETDAPFLAPVPYRGKRNEPAWVIETMRVVAEARGVPAVELADLLERNFARFISGKGVSPR
jgi:TatD DNase family protein